MANFIGPEVKQIYKDTMSKLTEDIGRDVIIKSAAEAPTDCPNCGWDPVKKRSNNRYSPDIPYPAGPIGPNAIVGAVDFTTQGILICPVCDGKGKINAHPKTDTANCLISSLSKEEAEITPLGKDYARNYELSTDIAFQRLFEKSDFVVIDGHVCKVVAVIPTGIGDLTRISIYAGG